MKYAIQYWGGIVEPDQLMLRMPKLMDGETGCCRVLNLVGLAN